MAPKPHQIKSEFGLRMRTLVNAYPLNNISHEIRARKATHQIAFFQLLAYIAILDCYGT